MQRAAAVLQPLGNNLPEFSASCSMPKTRNWQIIFKPPHYVERS
jgi:hypothetical protein